MQDFEGHGWEICDNVKHTTTDKVLIFNQFYVSQSTNCTMSEKACCNPSKLMASPNIWFHMFEKISVIYLKFLYLKRRNVQNERELSYMTLF